MIPHNVAPSVLVLVLAAWSPVLAAEPAPLPDPGGITEVVAVGPSWDTFTNRDGTGLYHELLLEVFGLYGITVKRVYVPSERAYSLVREGKADFMTCHDKPVGSLLMARHPMYENAFHAFFRRSAHPDFQGARSLSGARVAVRIGYYDETNFAVPVQLKEVTTGESALGMVILDRADFYVDDANFIHQSMASTTLEYDSGDFAVEPVGKRSYYPLFTDGERGRTIQELYDRGMEALRRRGALEPIFRRWHYLVPEYDVQ